MCQFVGKEELLFESLPQEEQELVNKELEKRNWEDINPDNCQTQIGKQLVNSVKISKYRREGNDY